MMMMMMGTSSNQNSNVFTAAQWEELEQQAFIYKYIISGVPVPTHLILSVRTSLYNSSSPSFHPTLGLWEGSFLYNQLYQIGGVGRKIDLEPGRCRRTDGKKWRCSKEAYLNSKYCARHMHRGRNRSRKPAESAATTLDVSSSSSTIITKSISHSDTYPALSSVHSSLMDSSSCFYQTRKDYRYLQGMESVYVQLNGPCATTQKMSSDHHHHYNDCCVIGTDLIKPSEETTKSSIHVDHTTRKQPLHLFSPPKTTLNPSHEPNHQLFNTAKAPLTTHDLFQSKPRPY